MAIEKGSRVQPDELGETRLTGTVVTDTVGDMVVVKWDDYDGGRNTTLEPIHDLREVDNG